LTAAARARVALTYLWRHGRWPAWGEPRRFTEWVQWRKLNDRDPALARLTDKAWSKERVGALAPGLSVPTLWQGVDLPADPPAPLPLVVKANHGCNQYRIVRTAADWDEARREAPGWLARVYGYWLDEWHYTAARPLLLVEPFLGGEGAPLPLDYKVYVFGGRAEVVQLHAGRGVCHRWTQFDRDWSALSRDPIPSPPPAHLQAMLEKAETLSAGFDFLRVDFYEVDGRLWFGEFCLFPGSGLDPFQPEALDDRLGACWSAVRPVMPAVAPGLLPAEA
jgi:hypothetical protein